MSVSERLQQIRFGGGDLNAQALKNALLVDLGAENVADIYAHIDYLEKRVEKFEKLITHAEEIAGHAAKIIETLGGEL
jgi:F420-dependent methylenetetrahydromethanopterin dehydrogenase